ncbi:uncharacterized protein LOC129760834 [Uranotaenia lowii]|uniref:uncharacterized protein LOC129760834 n=1 Tax=Uranotaenia lowii TaxID=190385 RepID=UPI002478CC29|nr:uncharacterized protein LOC129760834 [Uranotaenia lowii]
MWSAFITALALLFFVPKIDINSAKTVIETSTEDGLLSYSENEFDSADIGCKISLKEDITVKHPLLLVPGTGQFYTPVEQSSDLLFRKGESIELFCTHGFADQTEDNSLTAYCDGANLFSLNGESYRISELTCKRPPFHEVIRTEFNCFNGASLLRVGFNVNTTFVPLYEICFDEHSLRTHYVKHQLTPGNIYHQQTKRPPFIQGTFYPQLNMNKLYNFESQRNTLEQILGSQDRTDELLSKKGEMFFARGHLAAKADFVFSAQQRATFWFMNVAPQWQKFNGYNWQRIETGIKEFIARRNLTVTVYTGTYGTLELLDANGDPQSIYLDFDPNNGGRVPVSKVFYKIIHDELNDAGIVLIGVNNPHASMEEIESNYIFCDDISDQISWLKWKKDYIPGGFSYACDVNQFNDKTKHLLLPKIGNLLV